MTLERDLALSIEDARRRKAGGGDIYTALHAVYSKVGYVQKEKPKAGGLNYSYASEAALIEALRPALVEAGIVMHVTQATVDMRDTYTNKQGTVMNRTCITATVRFTHAPSATYIDVQALGEGIDAGDKSTPKAMTGAYKYALREAFCIETGDDPDQEPSTDQQRPSLHDWTNASPKAKAALKADEKKQDTPEAAARRKLWAVAQEKGMDQGGLYEAFGTDSLKELAAHMSSGKKDCDCGRPHALKDTAAAYRWMTGVLER